MKTYIYLIFPLFAGCIWFFNFTYMETDLIALYGPCALFMWSLKGKAKITKELLVITAVVMAFAVAAQLIGLDRVWRLPEQHLVLGDYNLFPIEELLYWHAGFSLPVLLYKHMEVYHYDLAIHRSIWFNRFAWRFVRLGNRTFETRPEAFLLILSSAIFALYMFVIESYCVMLGFFKYIDESITFYVIKVPFEGFLMYFCVAPFIYTVKWLYGRRRSKI